MKAIALIAIVWGLFLVPVARATDWSDMDISCALCGADYKSPFPVAYSSGRGMRLDFQPRGSSRAPWPLAACPACGFIQYTSKLTDEEKVVLLATVRTEEYQRLTQTRPTYYRLANLFEALGKDGASIGDAYLKASWQEERKDGERMVQMRECLEASLKHYSVYLEQGSQPEEQTAPPEKGCVNALQTAQLLKAELMRRLGRFDEAAAYLGLLKRLPESQEGLAREIIDFQLLLCAHRDSGPNELCQRQWYEQTKGAIPAQVR